MREDYTNGSGYMDPTASSAIMGEKRYPSPEEHDDESPRAMRLIFAMVNMLKETDFEFMGHIHLKSKKTGGIY